ncbi:tripartite tricarboxylate transporter TctB family protein [Vibrio fluvialis]|nr:tripartite tricarboxylate transporter TctB family protein [Vibrio fluvialis]
MDKSIAQSIKPSRRINTDTVIGLVSILVGCCIYFYVNPNFIETPSRVKNPLLSPDFLPNTIAVFLMAVGFGLTAYSLKSNHVVQIDFQFDHENNWQKKLLLVIALIIYAFAFETLGALYSAMIATGILFFAGGIRNITVYLLAIIIPLLVCLFFEHIINVPLPMSIWS